MTPAEIVNLRRAAEDAISAMNRHHTPFVSAAHPKAILFLLTDRCALIDELEALRANVKPAKPAKAKDYPPDFLAAYDAGRKWRAGSTMPAAFSAWRARINAGSDPQAIIAGAAAYARYCEATGLEKKMAQTFFGPGEHFSADWTIAKSAPAGRPGKFDPLAHVNQGRAQKGADDAIIDINPRY